MRVSVLIPTFNRANYIVESLESVLSQTRRPAEVIIIDDGSTDDTVERLAPYMQRIAYLRKENGGKSSALNLGMKAVTGEYVWIFDDDDIAYPDALARHAEVFASNPHIGSVMATMIGATKTQMEALLVVRTRSSASRDALFSSTC
jgi:glycosyltransferase involved in cell wall biosynthesis